MATRLYGLSRGEMDASIAEGAGSATAADSIELTVDLAGSLTKQDVIVALENLHKYIIKGKWPPA